MHWSGAIAETVGVVFVGESPLAIPSEEATNQQTNPKDGINKEPLHRLNLLLQGTNPAIQN